MEIRRSLAAIAGLALAWTIVPSAPVAAAPPVHESETYTETFVEEDWCGVDGLDVTVDQSVTVHRVIRTGRDGLDYFIEHFAIRDTHTANGVTTTYTERSLWRDHRLDYDEETGLLTLDVLATGDATLRGPDGKVIGKNPGQVRFHIVYDTVNEEELSFEIVFGSTGRNDDFCEVEVPLFLGS